MQTFIKINCKKNLNSLDFFSGKYKVVYNIFRDVLGSYKYNKIYVYEISTSRTEIRIRPGNVEISNTDWYKFNKISKEDRLGKYVVNFGNNKTVLITNWIFESKKFDDFIGSYILKLYEPLPDDIDVKQQCWITKIISNPIQGKINLSKEASKLEPSKILKDPNWDVDIGISTEETALKTWDDILSLNLDSRHYMV